MKPSKKKLAHLCSVASASRFLMAFWASQNGSDRCPRASKDGDYIRIAWADVDGSRKILPRRIWVVMPRWFDEYVDEILRGMERMAEILGVGLCVKPVEIEAINRAIEDIAVNLSPVGETLSIVSLMGNPSELKQSAEVARAEKFVKGTHKDSMFLTTVGRENSEIKLNNEAIGERLAEQMLHDLAEAGQLTGKVVLFGTSDKDSSDPYKLRRRRFRIIVDQRREDHGRPGHGHQLTMPDLRDIDSDLMFDPSASWKIRDLLLEFLQSPEGEDVRAVYTQTHQLTLGASLAIRDAGRLDRIRLYAEYVSPSLIRWLQDERWPLQAICGVDPYHYGRLILRTAYARKSDDDRRISIAPVLITREMVRRTGGLTYMIELPKLFPKADVRLDNLDHETQDSLSRDPWYRKLRDREEQSRDRGSA